MKKLICFSVVLVLGALAGFVGEAAAAPQLRSGSLTDTCWAAGDINGNGVPIEISDWVLAIRILICEAPVPDSLYRMDLNGDCNVNQYDMDLYQYFIQYGPSVLPGYPRATCCTPILTLIPPEAKGDVNRDGHLTSADAVLIVNCIFTGTGGNCSFCQTDLNCDYKVTPADVVQELNYVFLGTPPAGCP